jgi:hypothetical protein
MGYSHPVIGIAYVFVSSKKNKSFPYASAAFMELKFGAFEPSFNFFI